MQQSVNVSIELICENSHDTIRFFENPMVFKKMTTAAVEKNLMMYPRIITRSKQV